MTAPAHHPPHVTFNDTWYFITASVFQKRHLLQPAGHKVFVRERLKALVLEFRMTMAAWVILDNHYHMLVKSNDGGMLPHFIQRLHGSTSFELNTRDNARGRQVWHNYWDTCMRTECDYWMRFNYIHHNPVKHGYVEQMEQWPYSSYRVYLERKGAEWLSDAFSRYPIIDYTDSRDTF